MEKSVKDMLDEKDKKANDGPWMVANSGTERPFISRSGKRLLYMWQPSTGKHAYYDMGADVFLTDEEAIAALG
jgi:hypothetical protein